MGGLIGISNCFKTTNIYLNSGSDMNLLNQGIYMYSPEAGYPKNFPVAFGRGTIEVMKSEVHIIQKVFDFNSDRIAVYIRLSYDSGQNWYKWFSL